MKACIKCNKTKELDAFATHPNGRDGKASSCKDCKNAYGKTWNSANKERNRANTLLNRYGVTIEEYNALFASQNGKCAICSKHQSELKQKLAVDHCHGSGRFEDYFAVSATWPLGC